VKWRISRVVITARSQTFKTILVAAAILVAGVPISSRLSYASKDNYLPNITLTNQNSRGISLSTLRGKPVLVGFIHTMCKGVCQMMTANMRSVASALSPATAAHVTMLLITTDPADDQPPQLLNYAKKQELTGKGWVLVTGPAGSIRRVMQLYGVQHEESDDAMMHVMKLFLVAPAGTLARVYPGMKLSPQAVASDIETLIGPNRGSNATP
jgi:protein SCO1/2